MLNHLGSQRAQGSGGGQSPDHAALGGPSGPGGVPLASVGERGVTTDSGGEGGAHVLCESYGGGAGVRSYGDVLDDPSGLDVAVAALLDDP